MPHVGDMGSVPGRGTKIPHMAEQLSPSIATRESVDCSERVHTKQGRPLMPQLGPDAAK